jgi:hypothetical protein
MSISEPKLSGRVRVPRSRALVNDVLKLHRKVPTCAHDRVMHLSQVATLRDTQPQRVGWSVIFLKAFAILSAKHHVLRQTFRKWPWAHIFQHAETTALVATHRKYQQHDWLLWGRFRNPEKLSLVDLQQQMDWFSSGDVEAAFDQQLKFSALPSLIRKAIWWWNFNVAGEKRGKRTGTFSMTSIASRGAEIQHPPGFQTSNLTYGPIDDAGCCRVTIAYDHRLMDGSFVAERLLELETTLKADIANELALNIQRDSQSANPSSQSSRVA